jgi:hypothetical protein
MLGSGKHLIADDITKGTSVQKRQARHAAEGDFMVKWEARDREGVSLALF